ncbi:hypothetical protein T06_8875 [Trichinella sp. T6]|nr:hypothetical protein T06_8875 [Trichinella sp. T6]
MDYVNTIEEMWIAASNKRSVNLCSILCGSKVQWMSGCSFFFHLSGPVCTLDLMVWFRTLNEVHSLVSALRVICKFFIALGRSLREKPGAIF